MAFIYFSLEDTRKILSIPDTLDDEELSILGTMADEKLDAYLFPFAEVLPLLGKPLLLAQKAANYYASSLWKARKNNVDLAKFYDVAFHSSLDDLAIQLKATPTTRTKRVSVQTEYKISPLFFQSKKF